MIRFDLLEVVDSNRGPKEYLAGCTQLFLDNLLVECGTNCSVVPDTDVQVRLVTRSQDLTLNWNTDETYTLDIVTNSRGRYRTSSGVGNMAAQYFACSSLSPETVYPSSGSSEAITVTNVNGIFSGYQPCQLVEND
jgi:hypothetical protein